MERILVVEDDLSLARGIEFALAREGWQVTLVSSLAVGIEDTGIGIPEEELPFIFRRFCRGKASGSLQHKGSGIGLALAKLIVELHGGIVSARSRVNEGTEITLTFPYAFPYLDLTKM